VKDCALKGKMKRLAVISLQLAVLVFLIGGQAWGAWNPVGFKIWQDSEVDTLFRKRIGGDIANYQKVDSSWTAIKNNWITIEDTLHTNRNALLKTDVNDKGQSFITLKYEGEIYTVAQRLIKLIWLKTDTWDWINVVDGVTWSTPLVADDKISWTNVFPGVDYKIQKRNASVAHGLFFKKAFLDSAVKLYNQRADSLTIALGNVIAYELVNVDDADSAIGNVEWRKLKQLGGYIFQLSKQAVHFPGSGSLSTLGVKQRWIKKAGKLYCVEYVMMKRIKQIHETYPDSVIWHNDVAKITGTTNIEDATIKSGVDADKNYGDMSNDDLTISAQQFIVIRVKNVASELGENATISACVCSVYCITEVAGNKTIRAYRVFKPWVEGTQNGGTNEPGATWNDWDNDDWEWTTGGCGSADDGGSDNSGDGTGADRKATQESSQGVNSTGWFVWTISADLAQDWYDGSANENGILLYTSSGGTSLWRGSENSIGLQPHWTFTYTIAGPAEGQVIIVD